MTVWWINFFILSPCSNIFQRCICLIMHLSSLLMKLCSQFSECLTSVLYQLSLYLVRTNQGSLGKYFILVQSNLHEICWCEKLLKVIILMSWYFVRQRSLQNGLKNLKKDPVLTWLTFLMSLICQLFNKISFFFVSEIIWKS